MGNKLDAAEATAQVAPRDATAQKLIGEVQSEMRSLSQARRNESYLDRGIDFFYNPTSADLNNLTAVAKDLESAVKKGDLSSICARQRQIELELAADEKHLHTKDLVDGIAKTVLTTAPLFIPGPVGLVGAIAINGLAQAKPDEKLSAQVLDFGLGGAKGGLMRGAVALGSAMELGVASRALLLGPAQRVLNTALSRETYIAPSGRTDILGGLEETVRQAINPINVATDFATFAVAGGAATTLDKILGGAIHDSALLSAVTTGGIFGFTAGAGHEVRSELQTTGHLTISQIALAGAEGAAISSILAVPGGLMAAHAASAENRDSVTPSQETADKATTQAQLSQTTDDNAAKVPSQHFDTLTGTATAHWTQLPELSDGQLTTIQGAGDYEQTIKLDGVSRSYKIHVPENYNPDEPMPAVVMLHGVHQDADSFANRTQMNAKADAEGFIAVYPEGTPLNSNQHYRAWNVPNWGLFHPARNADDVNFVGQVIDNVQTQLAADPNRTYLAGFSNGGMLAQEVAVNNGDKLAAVALVGASLSGKDAAPVGPVSVLDIHGTADPIVRYAGWKHTLGLVNMQPVSATEDYWLQADGIEAPAAAEERGAVLTRAAVNDENGMEFKQITIKGGMHGWPRPTSPNLADRSISATDEIWNFFSRHVLADATR